MSARASTLRVRATAAALGAIAFVVACVAHEAIGHGGACLASAGRVLLVTSVFFRCAPSPWFVDVAGPAANALVAAAALAVLAARARLSHSWRSLCVLVFAFDGCWAAGYAIYSAVSLQGDLAFPMRAVAASFAMPLRVALAAAGLLAYVAVTRTSMR
ncbi:MAG TPA: hypothetical protein VGC30_09065, partial [Dokdonella sp.]